MYASRAIAVFAFLSFTAARGAAPAVAGELAADALDTSATEGMLLPPGLGHPSPSAGPGGAVVTIPHAAAAPRSAGVLHLAWIDPVDAASRCAPAAREEAVRLFKAMGITARWRRAEAGEPDREGEIRVIVLDRLVRRAGATVVLGATPSRFEGRPFVWIHVPSVREAVRLVGGSISTLEMRDQYRLATALGRVIVHEVVHAVTPATPHGHGLMAPRLTAADLTAAALPVAPEVAVAVRAALSEAAPPATTPSDAGLLAAEHAGD